MEFTKLYNVFFTSSIREEDSDTRIMFLAMIGMSDRTGIVEATVGAIASYANVPVEKARVALGRLQMPDPESTSPEHEGRRVVKLAPNRWFVVQRERYLRLQQEEARRDYMREYMRTRRAVVRSAEEEAELEGLVSGLEEGWSEEARRREGEPEEAALNEEELGETWEGMWADFVATGVPRAVGKKGAWEAFVAGVKTQGDLEEMGRALVAYRGGLAGGERAMTAAQFFGCWRGMVPKT